jgi:hypothetical protein
MATSLIQRVQDSVRSQKSNFCSRATRVTTINGSSPVNPQDIVSYVDCEGRTNTVPYEEIFANNGYINDCVQGGCTVKSTGQSDPSNRYFVQFGTTDCETPPSENNVILQPCNLIGESFIVDPTGYNLTQGGVYNIQLTPLGDNPLVITQCYTVGPQTNQQASYNITGLISNVGDCNMCRRPTPTLSSPTPTVTFPTQTPMPPTFFSYIVGDTSYDSQLNACASSGGGTITVYSDTKELTVNSTFLYGDQQLKTPYNSNGFVYYSGKGNYVLSTGSDGKLTSLAPCT